jgi:hypothetical protein
MSDPTVYPHYVISLEEVSWGVLLVAITMTLHGLGMVATLRTSNFAKRRFEPSPSFLGGLAVLISASWIITIVHLLEVVVWAAFFLWKDAMPNASTSYYFALMDYTTLGSNYNLPLHWRLLEGMIGIAGLLTFAWSTGVLFSLAQEFQDQQLALLRERHEQHQRHQRPPPLPPPRDPAGAPRNP